MTDHARPNWSPGTDESGPHERPLSEAEFSTMPLMNPHQAFIVGDHQRPGFTTFMVEVEYTMYEPDTERNALFELVITKFPKSIQMLWATIAIPIEDLEKVREVAKKYGFELKSDYLPVCIDENGPQKFPLEYSPNIFCVQGLLRDEELLLQYKKHWEGVIRKHEQGIPWRV